MGYCAEMRECTFYVPTENTGRVLAKMKNYPYDFKLDHEGNIVSISFLGDKIDEDLYAFKSIASFVKDGSYIEMKGEDGNRWRWLFENGDCREVSAKYVWEV